MQKKPGFVFSRSFMEMLEMIPSKEQQLTLVKAIARFGLYGEETALIYPLNAFMVLVKAVLDKEIPIGEEDRKAEGSDGE